MMHHLEYVMAKKALEEKGIIKRVTNFRDGPITCLRCGKGLYLWWNGGELDLKKCCDLIYTTEHVQTDLVVHEEEKSRRIYD